MKKKHLFAVLLPAAGSGTRFGGGDKLLVDLHGLSVLQRSVALFAQRPDVAVITVVTTHDRFEPYRHHLKDILPKEKLHFVEGGRERWESVLFGLRHLAGKKIVADFVAVHDAARPLTSPEVIDETFQAAIASGGAVPCLAEPATLKRMGADGCVSETVNRRGLYQAQTPQCFELGKLLAGYEKLKFMETIGDITDDAQVYERLGWPVAITAGSSVNLKITTSTDVALARALVQAQKSPPHIA
jgi:2-C-methyl-D-erythritol 4-phosphate cytidylyltransferase